MTVDVDVTRECVMCLLPPSLLFQYRVVEVYSESREIHSCILPCQATIFDAELRMPIIAHPNSFC